MSASIPVPVLRTAKVKPARPTKESDRRRAARTSVLIPIRLRPVRFDDGNFEDITATVNISRGCLYVTTWRDSYFNGMRLLVTYPYVPAGKGMGWEYLGEVVRVDGNPDGRFRLAVKLQFVMQSGPNPRLIEL
ncbi:MAG: PilZ domain-containing protein [Candidatus Acidiferrales bacterium]